MAEIVWRVRAVRHLNEIAEYLQERNPRAANDYVSGLREACLVLKDFPERGRRYDARHRVIVFRNHLVLYVSERVRGYVVIAAIIDGRRDIAALLRSLNNNNEPH